MGMSDDYIDAIEAGSTCIRLGRTLYNMWGDNDGRTYIRWN
jgi:uncharacterized pyridoxal phosphate-containing UPF0001 family protein